MTNNAKFTNRLIIGTIIISIIGVIYILAAEGFVDKSKIETVQGKVTYVIGLIIMLFSVLVVHELGHLFAGLLQGFRLDLFVVGFLGLKRTETGTQFYLNKNMSFFGGIAGTSPVEVHEDNPLKFANVLLAGPMASILFALVCFVVSHQIAPPLNLLLFVGGAMSVGIFIATTLPNKTGIFFTDRKRYQRLMTPGKDQEVELALLRIMGNYAKDNSYENIPLADLQIMVSDDAPFITFAGLFYLLCFQLEKHGSTDDDTLTSFNELAKKMPKGIVKTFTKAIEDFKVQLNIVPIDHS